jgi:hypothetical protein
MSRDIPDAPLSVESVIDDAVKVLGLRRSASNPSKYHGECPVCGADFTIWPKRPPNGIATVAKEILGWFCSGGCNFTAVNARIEAMLMFASRRILRKGAVPSATDQAEMLALTMPPRRGLGTIRDVLLALVAIARAASSDEFTAGVRQIAEIAKIKTLGVIVRILRLLRAEGGPIRMLEKGRHTASRWKFQRTTEAWKTAIFKGKSKGSKVQHSNSQNRIVSDLIPPPVTVLPFESMAFTEAFRGHRAAGRIYAILKNGPMRKNTLAKIAGYNDWRSTTRPLKWLEFIGLAAQTEDGRWVATAKSIHQITAERGLSNATARQRERHAEDRQLHKVACAIVARRAATIPTGEVFDLRSGEMLIDPHQLRPPVYMRRWLPMIAGLEKQGFYPMAA